METAYRVKLEIDMKDIAKQIKNIQGMFDNIKININTDGIDDVIKKLKGVSDKGVKVTADTSGAMGAISEVTRRLSSIQDERVSIEVDTGSLEDNIKKAEREIMNLKQSSLSLKGEMTQLSREMQDAGKSSREITEALKDKKRALEDNRQASSQLQLELKKMKQEMKETEGANKSLVETFKDLITSLKNGTTEASGAGEALAGAFEGVGGAIGETAGELVGSFIPGIGGAISGVGLLASGGVAAGVALVGMITTDVINNAIKYQSAIADLQIDLGLTKNEANKLTQEIVNMSRGGYAIEDITEATKLLKQHFSLSTDEMEFAAQGLVLLSRNGYDYEDTIQAIKKMTSLWGISFEEAMDFILKGHQEGLNLSSDFLDSLIEYIPVFADMGFEGGSTFALLKTLVDDLGLSTDHTKDFVKEMYLTLTDGSDASKEAISALGLDYDDLNKRIGEGGETAVGAYQDVAKAMIENAKETGNTKAMQDILKGTYEYVGEAGVEAFANADLSAQDLTNTMYNAQLVAENTVEAMQQDMSTKWDTLTGKIGQGLIPILNDCLILIMGIGADTEIMVTNTGTQFQIWSNQIKAFFIELGIGAAEALNHIPGVNIDTSELEKTHAETIEYIQGKEKEMKDESTRIYNEWGFEVDASTGRVLSAAETKSLKAKEAMVRNIGSMKDLSKADLQALANEANIPLGTLETAIKNYTKNAADQGDKNIEQLRKDGKDALSLFATEIGIPLSTLESIINTKTKSAADTSTKNMANLNKDGSKEMNNMSKNASTSFNEVDKASSTTSNSFSSISSNTKTTVGNMIGQFERMRQAVVADFKSIASNYKTEMDKVKDKSITITTTYKTVGTPPEECGGKSKSGSRISSFSTNGRLAVAGVGNMKSISNQVTSFESNSRSRNNNYQASQSSNISINHNDLVRTIIAAIDSSNVLNRMDNNTRRQASKSVSMYNNSNNDTSLRNLNRDLLVINQVEGERRWG